MALILQFEQDPQAASDAMFAKYLGQIIEARGSKKADPLRVGRRPPARVGVAPGGGSPSAPGTQGCADTAARRAVLYRC